MKKIIICGLGFVLAAGLMTGCGGGGGQTQVTTAAAKSGRDLSNMVWQGTVEALSSIDVLPGGSGKVTEITAAQGQHVNQGDVLFTMDNTDAGLALAQAQAGYDAAAASFAGAKKASQQNTGVAPAEIAYRDAVNNFKRMQELYGANVISQVDFENAKSQMDAAESKLQAARNGQDGNYDTTKAQMESAKAALEIAQKRYDDCAVTAPITGLVTGINVEVGQTVSPQMVGATVIDDSGEEVEIQVADSDIDQLKTGLPMRIELQSVGKTCSGTISEISAVCDAKTGMYKVKIAVEDQAAAGFTGLAADIRAAETESTGSVFIPAKCIRSDENGDYVYVVSGDSAIKTAVTQGRKKNAYREITAGLEEGSQVVVQSSKALTDGMKVRVLSVE